MTLTFLIPGALRPFASGQDLVRVDASASNLGEALGALWRLHPGLRDRILTEQGDVRPHVNLFVGSESIRYTGGLSTPVEDGAEIAIIPAVSGG